MATVFQRLALSDAIAHDHPRAVLRDERDVSGLDRLVPGPHGLERHAAEHVPQHRAHLERCERRAQAATATAAERDPGERGRILVTEPALGPESGRILV